MGAIPLQLTKARCYVAYYSRKGIVFCSNNDSNFQSTNCAGRLQNDFYCAWKQRVMHETLLT